MEDHARPLPAVIEHPEWALLPGWAGAVIPGLAGWLGWGIRGQMGHETGAMVPGGMVGLACALTANDPELWRRAGLLGAATAMGVSFGGTETMAQTIGLTMYEDTRDRTYWWGMLGLTIKGACWWGLAGVYLGMAASDVDYSPLELLALTAGSTGLWHVGVELLNKPFNPPDELPAIYFSDKYHLAGDRPNRPRPEIWGGQLLALLGLLAYMAGKRDRNGLVVGMSGVVAGMAGWTGAQAVQAALRPRVGGRFTRAIDIWKIQETGFGLIAGTILGIGMRLARRGQPPLPPRARQPWWQKLLGWAAGLFFLGSHVAGKEWTDQAMDRMVIAGAGLAAAFASDNAAWLELLPLLNHYMVQNTVEYFDHEQRLPEVAATVSQAEMPVTQSLAALALALARAAKVDSRAAAAVGLVAMAWAHTNLSHVKMLSNRHTLGVEDEDRRPLPAVKMVEQVYRRSWDTQRAQLITETAFTVAAAGLTLLVMWALGRKRD